MKTISAIMFSFLLCFFVFQSCDNKEPENTEMSMSRTMPNTGPSSTVTYNEKGDTVISTYVPSQYTPSSYDTVVKLKVGSNHPPVDTTKPPPAGNYTLVYSTGYDTKADLDPFGHEQLGNGILSTTLFFTGPGSFKSVPANVSSGIRSEVQYNNEQTPLEGMIEYDVMYEVVPQNNCHSVQWHPSTSGGSASPGLWHVSGKFDLVNWKSGTNTHHATGLTIENGRWYHLKFEYKFGSSGYMNFYIDGIKNSKGSWVGQVGDGSRPYLKIGVNMWQSQTSVVYYDNLKVYKKS